MRIREIVRLGGRMLGAERKRSALVMGVVAVLFALALALNMGVAGLRRNYLTQAGWATEGQVVVAATAVGTGEVELSAGDEQGDLAVPTVGVSEATAGGSRGVGRGGETGSGGARDTSSGSVEFAGGATDCGAGDLAGGGGGS